ncbi:actinin alpha 2 [Podila epigama]|nr:actinin alpha 2 [Podila epigama]
MVRQFAASQLDTQKTAFMRWVNVQLANTSYTPMASIERDLRDGKRLIGLLEAVSKEPLKPERGNMRIHQMANVSKALAFLEKRTEDGLGTIGNEDIVDGNIKLTLGLIWIIIYRFQIQQVANTMAEFYPFLAADDMMESEDVLPATNTTPKSKKKVTSQQVDAKQALLRWVRYQLEDYSDVIPPIQDFHRSWRTGLAFAALIHRHDPSFIPDFCEAILPLPFETVDEWRRTLTMAFDIAFKNMALPRLLDPEDLVDVETPDERSIMTYISEYYLVMSKHQSEQDPAVAADLRAKRLQAKHQRLALAGEDQEATRRRIQEEEERRRREENEELERIRLRRMEIEGWSIRAAERAREEEEALRKRRQEEEERRLQRKLRREQREREKELLRQQSASGGLSTRNTVGSPRGGSVFSESEHEFSDSETEAMDPKEQEKRQQELDEKLTEYHQGIAELSEWIRQQDDALPQSPDTSTPLDRGRDLDPLTEAIKLVEEAQAIKEHVMSHLHDVREELLEFENPDLAPEQVSEMDKKWWELETLWTALTNKVVVAKDAAEEVKWIIDCTQEIDRVNGEIRKFEMQLLAAAEKRMEETIQDRSQKSTLEQQDVNLSSIGFLIKTYVDFLTSLMDPKVHHYDAPEHLTARNTELTTVILPHLAVVIEKAQQNLASDRLLRSFLDAYVLSEAWIGESIEWLANIEVPKFVSDDVWMGAHTVQQYVTRDKMRDLNLDFLEDEVEELKAELAEEQGEVTTFRSSGFAKLDEQAKIVIESVQKNEDPTADRTTQTVQDMMADVMSNLVKVEQLLPKEAKHCEYATKVMDYLQAARSVLTEMESSFEIIRRWEMSEADAQVEVRVIQVEDGYRNIEADFYQDKTEPYIWESVQVRHAGFTSVVKDLRVGFIQKQKMIHGDRQMKAFLDFTEACRETLRDYRTHLRNEPPWTGFGGEDLTPFDDFASLVSFVGQSLESFESGRYIEYKKDGEAAMIMASQSEARQDPAVVQAKLEDVSRLLSDIKALKSDRERDAQIVVDCRTLVKAFKELSCEYQNLQAEFAAVETLEPTQVDILKDLGERSNLLGNRLVALEQESAYRYLVKDPTCKETLGNIKKSQLSIEHDIARLQSNLESKQQWDLAWHTFSERVVTLEQYLNDSAAEMTTRGAFSTDFLCADDTIWRKGESDLQETVAANADTLSSLKNFQRMRLSELTALAHALEQCADLVGGPESLGPVRKEQFHKATLQQQQLRDHHSELVNMNNEEKLQLDLFAKRLKWSQVQTDAKFEVELLMTACQGLSARAAEQMREQIGHLTSMAAAKKMSRYDTALNTFNALVDQAKLAHRSIPTNLDGELVEFKNQYDYLDTHLDYASQLAHQAEQIAAFLEKAESVDSGLINAAMDLKGDKEASIESIELANKARTGYTALVSDLEPLLIAPVPAENIAAHYIDSRQEDQDNVKKVLNERVGRSTELDQALVPLLSDVHSLLEYQNGLRSLLRSLSEHEHGLQESLVTVAALDKLLKELYFSWPADQADGNEIHGEEHRATLANTRDTLARDLERETALIATKKDEVTTDKTKVNQALELATVHSRQLQATLERSMDSIDEKIRQVESELKAQSFQLSGFDCTVAWEKTAASAQQSVQETSNALTRFIEEDARWHHDSQKSEEVLQSEEGTVHRLKSTILDFEAQLKGIETESKASVDQTWDNLCSALVFASRSMPQEFEKRQAEYKKDIEILKSRIAYSHDVVLQRERLEIISSTLVTLSTLEQKIKDLADGLTLVANDSVATGEVSLSDVSAKIRSVAQELKQSFKNVHFPVDESCVEALTLSQKSNAAIREYIHSGQASVDQAVRTVEEVELAQAMSRKKQELETFLEEQEKVIADKTSDLENVMTLLAWADKTAQTVDELLHQELLDSKDDERDDNRSDDTLSRSESADKLSTTVSTLATLSMSMSESSVSTLTPTSPSSASQFKPFRESPSVHDLARHSASKLESLLVHVADIRLEVEEMKMNKIGMQKDISRKAVASIDIEGQINALSITDASSDKTVATLTIPADAFSELDLAIDRSCTLVSNLDVDISEKFGLFDSKADHLLEQLGRQEQILSVALKDRQQADIERALQEEAERFHQQKAQEMQAYKEIKDRFLAWAEAHIHDLHALWDTRGRFSRTGGMKDGIVDVLKGETIRCTDILKDQESLYQEVKSKMTVAFKDLNEDSEMAEQAEKIDQAWTMALSESNGYRDLLDQMEAWSQLDVSITDFEKKSLEVLEKRVEALRWLPWEAFQQEEADLVAFINIVEARATDLQEHTKRINSMEVKEGLLDGHKEILEDNRVFFAQRVADWPSRVQVARSQMEIIHETSKEIALHGKFHADLVRIETAIAQQIDIVKARLGSLERSSCFALNSQALEAVVVAANEVSVDARYQFSVLQEVEYSALEQTAFDLDMGEGQIVSDDGEQPGGYEGSRAASKTSVQESMERIRSSLKLLEGYIAEDSFETLLAAEFYTHTKATEDIRQWIGACRESMALLNAADFGCQGMDHVPANDVRQKAIEARTRHIVGLEKKLHQFGPTIQNYDVLSSDFFLLHHPASSTMNLPEPFMESHEGQGSMRTILRQTVQERTKRTREDWELLKQEFMVKVAALEELKAQHEKENATEASSAELAGESGLDAVRRGSFKGGMSKSKTIGRFGSEILEDIARVTREIEVMIEHGSPSLIENLDSLAQDVESNLEVVSNMVDRLNDWRLIDKHGIAVEHWQKVKRQAIAKIQELDQGMRSRQSSDEMASGGRRSNSNGGSEGNGLCIHPLEGNTSRSSVMQPTASSSNRTKAILGSPADPTPASRRKKRFSTSSIMNRGTFSPPSPGTPTSNNNSTSNLRAGTKRLDGSTGRVRSGTAPGLESTMGGPLDVTKKSSLLSSPSLQAMSPTFAAEARRRPPIIRKNDSNTSISSAVSQQDLQSPLLRPIGMQQRNVYKADPSSSLDVEVARVVNASGFSMKVQKLKDGQAPPFKGYNGSTSRLRSSSTVNLAVESDGNVESLSGMDSAGSSPRAVKTIWGQGRMSVSAGSSSPGRYTDDGNATGEVGRYVFGDIEPKVCYCRILRSRKVMVRVGGGWSELSKFMEDHASLEQRKAKGRLSASNSAISIASTSHLGGLLSDSARSVGNGGSSDSLPESVSSDNGRGGSSSSRPRSNTGTPMKLNPKRKEFIYHVRPSDDLSLKTIKFVKNGAGEALVTM